MSRFLEEVSFDARVSPLLVNLGDLRVRTCQQVLQLVGILENFGLNLAIHHPTVHLDVIILIRFRIQTEGLLSLLNWGWRRKISLWGYDCQRIHLIEIKLPCAIIDEVFCSQLLCHFARRIIKCALIAHKFDEVRLEDASQFVSLVLDLHKIVLVVGTSCRVGCGRIIVDCFCTPILNSIPVKQKHPLTLLKVFNVEL